MRSFVRFVWIGFFTLLVGAITVVGWPEMATAAITNPKHFVDPSAVPTFGANNYVTQFDPGDDSIVDLGTAHVTSYTNLWTVGAAGTTKQEFTDLYNRRINSQSTQTDLTTGFIHDGSGPMSSPLFTAHAPGYITGSGNLYSFAGNYGAHVDVANYGGASNSRPGGTFVIMQTSAALNPDFRPPYNVGSNITGDGSINPGVISITKQNGDAIAGAQILSFDKLFQDDAVPSSFGEVAWQELIWTAWLPDYTGDFRIDFGIPVHSAFSALRVDTAIGSMTGTASAANFTTVAVPEPSAWVLLTLGAAGICLCRRLFKRKE